MASYLETRISSMTVVDLKHYCKEIGLTGYSKLRKAELIDFITFHQFSSVDCEPSDLVKSIGSDVIDECRQMFAELPTKSLSIVHVPTGKLALNAPNKIESIDIFILIGFLLVPMLIVWVGLQVLTLIRWALPQVIRHLFSANGNVNMKSNSDLGKL